MKKEDLNANKNRSGSNNSSSSSSSSSSSIGGGRNVFPAAVLKFIAVAVQQDCSGVLS